MIYNKKSQEAGDSVVECMFSMCEALGFIPSTPQKRDKKYYKTKEEQRKREHRFLSGK
jgi:hypothetical protein